MNKIRTLAFYIYNAIEPMVLVALTLIIWQLGVAWFKIPQYLLPSPVNVFRALWVEFPRLIPHIWITTYETVLGFLIATFIGIIIAVLIAHSRFLQRTLYPILIITQTTPKVAVAPIFVVWFGFGMLPKITLAFLVSFFPVVINMSIGLLQVDPNLVNLVRSYEATRWKIFTKVRLQNSMPYLFAGMKIAITMSVVGAIIGEFVGGDIGLGYVIIIANQQMKAAVVFATLVILAIMGIVLFWIVSILEKILVPWASTEEIDAKAGGL